MRDLITQNIEDYLKVIYDLSATYGRATTNRIAESLGVKPASVTGMIKKLSVTQPPLVEYRKHRGVVLTFEGEKIALEIIRHHRLIELYLYENLGYTWDQVHAEADRLEHVISDEFEERIAQVLGNPQRDPHGDPIPSRELKMPPQTSIRLDELRPGQQGIVKRVRDTEAELLRYLHKLGVVPQVSFSVVGYSPFDENLQLKIAGRDDLVVLGPRITNQIFVEVG